MSAPPKRRCRSRNPSTAAPKCRTVKSGQATRREVVLGVGALPEQEVRYPELARGPDDEIRVRQPAGIERRRHRRLRDVRRPQAPLLHLARERPDRAGQLVAPAVVDGDREVEAAAVAGALLHRLHQPAQAGRHPVAHADEPHPHVVAPQPVHLGEDILAEDLHQPLDLGERPLPVLGREGVEGEVGDAEVGTGLDDLGHPPRAARMARNAAETAGLGPAAVSVHDDPDMDCRGSPFAHSPSTCPIASICVTRRREQQFNQPCRRKEAHNVRGARTGPRRTLSPWRRCRRPWSRGRTASVRAQRRRARPSGRFGAFSDITL